MTFEACDLPSYGEATTRADGWQIVAPHVPVASYPALCLVSSRLHAHFAARLWNDPLRTVRLLGLGRHEDLRWYLSRFIGRSVRSARASTRSLVLTLDFRDFARETADFLSDEALEVINDTLRRCHTLFPALRCLLLDAHPILNPAVLARPPPPSDAQQTQDQHRPLLLSIAGPSPELHARYLESDYMRNLVYLDISYLPGSLRSTFGVWAIGPRTLPCLRVLKVRGRELEDAIAVVLATSFMQQLWSLDLGENLLTEDGLHGLLACCLPHRTFQSNERFAVEGRLLVTPDTALNEHGPFVVIEESAHSAAHSHPERHLADTPTYHRSATEVLGQEEPPVAQRPDGTAAVLGDGPDDLVRYLSQSPNGDLVGPKLVNTLASRPCRGFQGLTHLTVDGNRLTLTALEKAIRLSHGAFEHLDCDMLLMRPPPPSLSARWLSRSTRICGFIGASHLLRPVISSSLRSVRVHHSIVTQTPTLVSLERTTSSLADSWIAEELLLPGVELAHTPSGAFTPDMNPRLTSLMLTNLPRRSTGRLVKKLTRFLELSYEQERAILETATELPASHRCPALLMGLRRLRLEFEPDLIDEADSFSGHGDAAPLVDGFEAMSMDVPPAEFSFFQEWRPETAAASAYRPQGGSRDDFDGEVSDMATKAAQVPPLVDDDAFKGEPSDVFPEGVLVASDGSGEYLVRFATRGEFEKLRVEVWIGPGEGVVSPHVAVNEYVKILRRFPSLRAGSQGVGPATPSQVEAGVPPGRYVFQWAWEAMIWTGGLRMPGGQRSPRREELLRMYDVVGELKRFRRQARDLGKHWSGRLEVVSKQRATGLESWQSW